MDQEDVLGYCYRFDFGEGEELDFEVKLNHRTLRREQSVDVENLPEWTELDNHKCENCSLSSQHYRHCPAAVNLLDAVKLFNRDITRRLVTVRIETPARTYEKYTSLQEALSSLVGLCLASSDCPVLSKFRPMLVIHLPFATMDETVYRAVSMYLFAQFVIARKQAGDPDWKLEGLAGLYESVHTVNQHFHQRLAQVCSEDASPAALVMLDLFSQTMSFSVGDQELDQFEVLFAGYLKPGDE